MLLLFFASFSLFSFESLLSLGRDRISYPAAVLLSFVFLMSQSYMSYDIAIFDLQTHLWIYCIWWYLLQASLCSRPSPRRRWSGTQAIAGSLRLYLHFWFVLYDSFFVTVICNFVKLLITLRVTAGKT